MYWGGPDFGLIISEPFQLFWRKESWDEGMTFLAGIVERRLGKDGFGSGEHFLFSTVDWSSSAGVN